MEAQTNSRSEHFSLIPIDQLIASKTNPRKHFGNLAELVDSVKQHGVIVPLIARKKFAKGELRPYFEIVAGERRFRAAKEAGLTELPAIVRELDDKETLELQVIENLQRADVHPIEEADGYSQLITKHGYDVAGLAARVGKSESYIYQRLKLAALIPKAKEAFFEEHITASHAILIARLDEKQQKQALEYALPRYGDRDTIGVREFQEWIHEEFYLDLHAAPWKKDDAALDPTAGACVNCPKRSGFAPALFPELARGKDLCRDAKCYRGKLVGFIKRAREEAPEVPAIAVGYLPPGERKALEHDYGKVQDVRTFELSKPKAEGATQGLVVYSDYHAHGRVGQRLWFSKQKHQSVDSAVTKHFKTQQRRRELERERRAFGREAVAEKILAAVPATPAERELRIVAQAFFDDLWSDLSDKILRRNGIEAGKGRTDESSKILATRLATWDQAALTRFLVELSLAQDAFAGGYHEPSGQLAQLASLYDVDAKRIQAAAEKEWTRVQKAKEVKAKKKAKPATKAKPKRGVCRKCGCTETTPCMTALGPCAWTDRTLTLCTACEGKATQRRKPRNVAALVHRLHSEKPKEEKRANRKAAAATA